MRTTSTIHRGLQRRSTRAALLAAAVLILAACSSESSSVTTSTAIGSTTTVESTTTTVKPTTTDSTTTTTTPIDLEQLAIWPAADVVYTTPEAAAADFVATVLEVPVALSEFMPGDNRSGEIEVSCDRCNATSRGTLLMRQLGADNGWFVTAIVNGVASISSPAADDDVTNGVLTVEGVATGFEANVSVSAYVAGSNELLDQEIVLAGTMGEPGDFSVTLDLSKASTGDVVMLLVRGGVGLETDPGELAAIAVVVA